MISRISTDLITTPNKEHLFQFSFRKNRLYLHVPMSSVMSRLRLY